MPRVPPDAATNDLPAVCRPLLKAVHLYIRNQLQRRRAQAQRKAEDRREIYPAVLNIIERGQHTKIDHQRGKEHDAKQTHKRKERAGLFPQHGIAPVLMIVPLERIGPVCGQTHTPIRHADEQRDRPRAPHAKRRNAQRQNHYGCNRPIGIVDRGVAQRQAHGVNKHRCREIRRKHAKEHAAGHATINE